MDYLDAEESNQRPLYEEWKILIGNLLGLPKVQHTFQKDNQSVTIKDVARVVKYYTRRSDEKRQV
jgi:hypothetical protein